MVEKIQAIADTEKLNEYDQFLLDAQLQQAGRDVGRPLSVVAKLSLTLTFFEERQQVQRAQIIAYGHRATVTLRPAKPQIFSGSPLPHGILIETSRSNNYG